MFPAYQNSLNFFIYNEQKASIDLLKIVPNDEIKIRTGFYTWKHRSLITMQACRESNEILIFDDKPSMRRLRFDNGDNDEEEI
jgi:hypothetical protein